MTDSDINDLHPELRPLALQCLSGYLNAYPDRHPAKITVTWRSAADQQKAYDTGKSNAEPGQSKHEFTIDGKPASKAFDYAIFDEHGNYIADGTDDWYADFARIGKALGLAWGGDWTGFKDWDHMELKD